jgi:hypothetical protein
MAELDFDTALQNEMTKQGAVVNTDHTIGGSEVQQTEVTTPPTESKTEVKDNGESKDKETKQTKQKTKSTEVQNTETTAKETTEQKQVQTTEVPEYIKKLSELSGQKFDNEDGVKEYIGKISKMTELEKKLASMKSGNLLMQN